MQVILLSDVPKVGRKFEVKNVSDGYAANFLFPRRLAERATPEKLAQVKARAHAAAAQQEVELSLLDKNLAALKKLSVHVKARANEQGHLYEGIRAQEVLKALSDEHRIELPEGSLELPHPLKSAGEHKIDVSAHGRKGVLTVVIEPTA